MSDDVTPLLRQAARVANAASAAGSPIAGVRRIGVVRDDRLGDFVVTLPAVAALHEAYPHASFAVVVAPRIAPLAQLVGGVDRVLVSEAGQTGRLTRSLRDFAPDLVVCASQGSRAAWAAWRAGVRHRVGPGRRLHSVLFTRRVGPGRRGDELHEADRTLAVARRAGAGGGPVRFPLDLPAQTLREADAWLESAGVSRRFALVHPGSGGSCPRWPAGHFRGLVERLTQRGVSVVVSAGPDDAAWAAVVARAREPGAARPVVFDGGLPALAAVVSRASLVVGSSTGPIHLAAALGTPTLAIHAPWASCGPGRWGPYAANGWALVAHQDGALRWSRAEREGYAGRLMAGVPVDTVADLAEQILAGREPALP